MLKRIFSKQNRVLLAELVRTDFKLRYQGSVLGYIWSLLRPLLIFLILYLVFVKFLKLGGTLPHYPVYLLFGMVLWNFFGEMTMQSLSSIVNRRDLIRKIRIPRWIIVLSTSLSAVINLLLNLIIVAIFMFFNHVPLMASIVLLPFSLIEIYFFSLGVSLILATMFVKFRDVSYIWEVSTQALFYLIPIFYPLSRISSLTLRKILLLNPLAQAMQDARYTTITHQSQTIYELFRGGWHEYIPYMICAIVLFAGIWYFRRQSRYFAEDI